MTQARAALLATAAIVIIGVGISGESRGAPTPIATRRHGTVIVFIVAGVSFEELLRTPQVSTLARAGGAALMATNGRYRDDPEKVYEALGSGAEPTPRRRSLLARTLCRQGVDVGGHVSPNATHFRLPSSEVHSFLDRGCIRSSRDRFVVDWIDPAGDRREVLAEAGPTIGDEIRRWGQGRTLVLVVSPTPSTDMISRGDEVGPIILAEGRPDRLLLPSGPMLGLRSTSTRETGLVANVDVAPTILDFFGIPIPSEMDGQPIRVTNDPAPYTLHRLHLEQRRIRFPIQLAEVAFVSGAGAVAIVALVLVARRRLPPRLTGPLRFMALCGASLSIPLMLGGVLPRLTYWVVVPFLVLSVLALAALARAAPWPGSLGPFTFLGVVGLAVVIVDAMLGWRGARIPLIGGTMFDGARFYGLPNAFLSLLLASALFVAAALPAFAGFLVLFGAGLFAGFPSLGADLGGAMTVFFAAGLWWVLRTRRRFRIKELAFVAGVTVLGLGAVLLANRYLPGTPTHATRFVERTGSHLGDALHEFGDRLGVSFEQVRKAPPALIPLLGLPIILALVLMRPGPIGRGLDLAGKPWKQALVVLTLGGVVAFFANDTGVAAAAPVFLYAMSAMAYPAFLAQAKGCAAPTAGPKRDERGIDE